MSRLRWLKLFFYLFFKTVKFIEIGTTEAIERAFRTNEQLSAQYPDKSLPVKRVDEFRESIAGSTRIVKQRIKESFIISISTLSAALLSGSFFDLKRFSHLPKVLAVISTFLLLWAVFGRAGWEIQTIGGDTLPEKANEFWIKFLQALGMYLLFLAILM